mmetsp:Transcript_623/g.1342  ORF Transcript_623/g.1342 Transcript_623/m.1342 type:complete len:230 (+) Transcript_623:1212-1901(+)
MQRKIPVVVLLRGTLWEDLQQQLHAVQGSLLPGGEVQCEIAVIVRHAGRLGVAFQQTLDDFDGGAEGCGGVEGEVAAIVLASRFVTGARILTEGEGRLPSLRQFVEVDVFGIGYYRRCGIGIVGEAFGRYGGRDSLGRSYITGECIACRRVRRSSTRCRRSRWLLLSLLKRRWISHSRWLLGPASSSSVRFGFLAGSPTYPLADATAGADERVGVIVHGFFLGRGCYRW